MSANAQAQLVKLALTKAAEAGLRVWSVTADGTSVNLSTFRQLGCTFGTTYDTMVTKFKHPTQDYFVHVILDPCHMLKLARNALAKLSTFSDSNGGKVKWAYFQNLYAIQEKEGLKLGNKLSTQHMQFEKHKMNVQLAAQTLNSSVADAIEFLDVSMKVPEFQDSQPTVTFTRTMDQLFDILNSRNPVAKGYKQPLRPQSKETWEKIPKTTANYLLTLKTVADSKNPEQLLSTHPRKTFVIGFVATINSTIEMANSMFTMECPFKYLLTYKYSQDHLELLFSCIRSRGGWNNNPSSLQLKYALRKMLLRNAVTASKYANCIDFNDSNTSSIIPIFHTRKHEKHVDKKEKEQEKFEENLNNFTPEECVIVVNLDKERHTEFISNILFYIGGFVVSKLLKLLTCKACKQSLVSNCPFPTAANTSDHNYCGIQSMRYAKIAAASAFTLFINKGGLQIPSQSVFQVLEYAEQIFKAYVCKDGNEISNDFNLRSRMVLEVCHHFIIDKSSHQIVFEDHEQGMNESLFEDDHRVKLIKYTADKYFTLRLFTYGKRYCEKVIQDGRASDRYLLSKMILFKNQ